jgi:hypothetical protein
MDKKEKRVYFPPKSTIIVMEAENFFCTSADLKASQSTIEDYGGDEEVDEGDIEFGY